MILSNQIICKTCQDAPYSAHRHDFSWCKCKAVAADGGTSYLKRTGLSGVGYTDISIVIEDSFAKEVMAEIELIDGPDDGNDIKKWDKYCYSVLNHVLQRLCEKAPFYEVAGQEMTIPKLSPEVVEKILNDGIKAMDSGRNAFGILCAVARGLRDHGGVNISDDTIHQ